MFYWVFWSRFRCALTHENGRLAPGEERWIEWRPDGCTAEGW